MMFGKSGNLRTAFFAKNNYETEHSSAMSDLSVLGMNGQPTPAAHGDLVDG